jgi:hypothetical protein
MTLGLCAINTENTSKRSERFVFSRRTIAEQNLKLCIFPLRSLQKPSEASHN